MVVFVHLQALHCVILGESEPIQLIEHVVLKHSFANLLDQRRLGRQQVPGVGADTRNREALPRIGCEETSYKASCILGYEFWCLVVCI